METEEKPRKPRPARNILQERMSGKRARVPVQKANISYEKAPVISAKQAEQDRVISERLAKGTNLNPALRFTSSMTVEEAYEKLVLLASQAKAAKAR